MRFYGLPAARMALRQCCISKQSNWSYLAVGAAWSGHSEPCGEKVVGEVEARKVWIKFEYAIQPHGLCKLLEMTVKVRDESSVSPRTGA
jgi:hypothetical protein